jgi:MinD-like ATPase involved in chromosome partitioning or flagellar assembly
VTEKKGGEVQLPSEREGRPRTGSGGSDSIEILGRPTRLDDAAPASGASRADAPEPDEGRAAESGASSGAPRSDGGGAPPSSTGTAAGEPGHPGTSTSARTPAWMLPPGAAPAPPAAGGAGRFTLPASGTGAPPGGPGQAAGSGVRATSSTGPAPAPSSGSAAGFPGPAPAASAPGYRPQLTPPPGRNGAPLDGRPGSAAQPLNGRPAPAAGGQLNGSPSPVTRPAVPPSANSAAAPATRPATPPSAGGVSTPGVRPSLSTGGGAPTSPARPAVPPAGNGTASPVRAAEPPGASKPLPGPALISPQRPAPGRGIGRLASLAPDPEPQVERLRPAPPAQSTAQDLAPESVRPVRIAPATRGWRRTIRALTFGAISPKPGRSERRERELTVQSRAPIATCRRVAIVSRKGGIGKTTTTLMLGHTFALHRGDRVVALDANPDAGSLAYRVHRETGATVTQLLRAAERIRRYSDMRTFTSQSSTRLEVLASDDDPTISVALGEAEYREVMDVLEHHYNLILMDTGTGILDSATQGILRMADQIVVCAAPGIDASRASSLTLDWLDEHGYHDLVRDAVVVINQVRRDGGRELRSVTQHFAKRCRAVVKVPWDPHLAEGLEVDVDRLRPQTRRAYLGAAAAVAKSFSLPARSR